MVRSGTGAATGKNKGTRCRECDPAIASRILCATIVSRSGADGDPSSSCLAKQVVQSMQSCPLPQILGCAPADRENRGMVSLVMDGPVEGVYPPVLVIRSKVGHNECARCQSSGQLNIECDFRIVARVLVG